MKQQKKMVLLLALVLILSAVLSACGGNSEESGSETNAGNAKTETPEASATPEPPTEISIMSLFYTPEPPGEDNPIIKEIEKRTNTKLKITWVSPNNYGDKMNVTLASGEIPDLMLVFDTSYAAALPGVVHKMAAQGAFWDITDMIKDYPNLNAYPAETWKNTSINGKIYGVPRVRPTEGGDFPYIRKDWLDNLGLKVPETLDDFYKVAKAFTENDPDGNNKNDTVGITGYVSQTGMGSLYWVEMGFNGSGEWKLVDGKLVHRDMLPGTREALIWMKKAYDEGLIPADFAVMKLDQAKDMLKSGKAGISTGIVADAWAPTAELRKTNPKAEFLPLPYITLPDGTKYGQQKERGLFGMYVIPKTVDEAKVKKLLAFMDFGSTQEGDELAKYGIKDVHYTEKDGVKTPTPQAEKDSLGAFAQLFKRYDKYDRAYAAGIDQETYERNKKIIDEREKYSISNPKEGLISETDLKLGQEYKKRIQDLKTKIILGQQPITAWDEFVANLAKDQDFQKIVSEYNEALSKK